MSNTISVSVVADVAALRRGMDDANRQLRGFDQKASQSGKRIKQALTVGAAVAGMKTAIGVVGTLSKSASDSEQSIGAVESIFKQYSSTVVTNSKKAAQAYGLSATEYRENASLLGALFKGQGVELGKLAGKTEGMIGVAADLSATFGGSTKQAVEALSSAFKGETDPIEKYGISIKESDVKARLAAKGQEKLTGAAMKQAQQVARTELIMAGAKDAQGAFARESNTLAGAQQRLSAQMDNLKSTAGTKLLPALTKLVSKGNQLLKWTTENPGKVKALAVAIGVLGTVVLTAWTVSKVAAATSLVVQAGAHAATVGGWIKQGAAATASGAVTARIWLMLQADAIKSALAQVAAHARIAAAWVASKVAAAGAAAVQVAANARTAASYVLSSAAAVAHRAVTLATAGAMKVAAAAQWLLNAAMRANPIGLVITAISLLVGGLILAYKKSDTFRAVCQKAFAVVKLAAGQLWSGIKKYFGFVMGIYGAVGGLAVSAFKKVTGAFADGWNAASRFFTVTKSKVGAAVDFIGGMPGRVKGFFVGAGDWLIDAGQKVIGGLISGIRSKLGDVKAELSSLTSKLPSWKGPPKRDRKILRGAGQLIMKGLVDGIGDGAAGVRAKLGSVTKTIAATFKALNGKAASKDQRKIWDQWVASNTKGLQRVADRYKAKMAEVAAATQKLADLVKQSADYAAGVSSSALSYANITGAGVGEDGKQSAATIRQGLTDRLSAIETFTKQLDALRKKGLNKTTYDQLVQAGVEGGSETVRALTVGGQAAVSSVNTIQGKINAASKTLGQQTSNTMYGAGIQAAQGLVRGLKSQAANIAKYAKTWAAVLTKAVKKALKIKSPSRVFRDEIGKQIVEGLIRGTSSAKVAAAGVRMAGSFKSGFGRPALAGSAGGAAGGNVQIIIQVPAVANPAAVGKEVAKALAAYVQSGGKVVTA